MALKNASVTVICPEKEFIRTYSFLQKHAGSVSHINAADLTGSISELSDSDIVFFDGHECRKQAASYLRKIDSGEETPRVFYVWDIDHMLSPESLSRVFYFFKKPFKKRALLKVMRSALSADVAVEQRREIRFDKKTQVELCYEEKAFLTETTNLSLHGMQAVWPTDDYIEEISARLLNREKSISECFLYMNDIFGPKIDNLYLNVDLRYIQNSKGKTLMGFEFENIDSDSMEKIYRLISA